MNVVDVRAFKNDAEANRSVPESQSPSPRSKWPDSVKVIYHLVTPGSFSFNISTLEIS